ncbi:hypothetical protein DOY81_006251 [Sarcophaga bullata]|nr:hypothetical protein DOY81_006251 [Sarcophaga bullata]
MILKKYSLFCIIFLIVNFCLIRSQSHVSVTPPFAVCPPNFELKNGLCYPSAYLPKCPPDYFYHTDGLCYPIVKKPCPFDEISKSATSAATIPTNLQKCPPDYFYHTDGLCYPTVTKPCPADDISKSIASTTTTTTTTTTPIPMEVRQITCPRGSIMHKNKCRKIMCTLGEYYKGSCNRPICPSGLVWRGKQCQKPGFLTTIIEIDNVFVNQINEKQYALETSEHDEIISHPVTNLSPATTTSKPESIKASTIASVNDKKPHLTSISNATCCHVISPRICKKYGKWQCFSRKFTICDDRVCTASLLYLKAPEIKYEPPILVMPPNPQLDGCKNSNCTINTDIIDCSGCANRVSEKCTPYCYSYVCPNGNCTYMNLKDYCTYYAGQNGCKPNDGCLWTWCTKSM